MHKWEDPPMQAMKQWIKEMDDPLNSIQLYTIETNNEI